MLAFVFASLTLLALGVWAACAYFTLLKQARVWRATQGPFSVELRRLCSMTRSHADSMAFPQPREMRTLTVRLAGVPIWAARSTIGLPLSVDARIDSVKASEFDALFDSEFRQSTPAGWRLRPGQALLQAFRQRTGRPSDVAR
jgi:hypothetical protein